MTSFVIYSEMLKFDQKNSGRLGLQSIIDLMDVIGCTEDGSIDVNVRDANVNCILNNAIQ